MQIKFLTTSDHVRIATAQHGAGPLLVFVRGWSSHLEHLWNDPLYRAYFEALGERFTVVRFDMRGNGLSDRHMPKLALEGMVADIEAVMDSLGDERVVLYGQCFGGPAAIAYAAAHPERVDKLILDGTYADGRRVVPPERRKRILTTLRDLPQAGMAFMTHMTHPNPTPTQLRSAALRGEYFYENALELYTFGFRVDVTPLLPRITMPTLILHRLDTRAIPFRLGRELASHLPGALFVPLEGQAHNPWDEYAEDALSAIGDFLGVTLTLPAEQPEYEDAARTILITATDALAPALLREYNTITREALREHHGVEFMSDERSIVASFSLPSRAIECAIAIQRALSAREDAADFQVRMALNSGELGPENDDALGPTALLARQICDAGPPSGILVTNVVRELCAGKGFMFSDHGVAGTGEGDEPVRLFEVRWREDA